MNKNEDLWKWALLVLVSQTVSHPWIRSDEVIGWTWSSLETNLVLLTHTYPITRSFFKILHIRNNLQSNNQLGISFGNGECVIVGESSTKVLLFCFKKNCYLYWGNNTAYGCVSFSFFFFFFLNNPLKWWNVIRSSVLEERWSNTDARLFSICPSSFHVSTCWLLNQRRPSSFWTPSVMTLVTITVRSWNSKHFLKANGFQMWTFALWAHLSRAWQKMLLKWMKTLSLELVGQDAARSCNL